MLSACSGGGQKPADGALSDASTDASYDVTGGGSGGDETGGAANGGTGAENSGGASGGTAGGGSSGASTGGTQGGSNGMISDVTLRLDPTAISLVDDGAPPAETAQVRAFATIAGQEREVTDEVTWALDPTTLVNIEGGLLTTRGHGGVGTLMARYGAAEATAAVTIRFEASSAAPDAPQGASSKFPTATSGDVTGTADSPRIVYPSHETMFPRNLERVLYQWDAGNTLDLFEVRFESAVALVRYYTTQKTWLPSSDIWHWIADTHAGTSVTVSIRGVSTANPSKVYRSQDVTLYFSAADVPGAIYYWSTGAAGVLRATLPSPQATKFYTDPTASDKGTCVSCHTVSRNGTRLAAGYDGEKLRQISVPDRTLQIPASAATTGASYGFGTFSPDASRLLYADKGKLTLLNAATGAKLADVTLPAGAYASQPDWAPDGAHVAVAYQTSGKAPGNKSVQGTSLARIPVLANDKFGTPEVLVASTGSTDTLYFPSYSPDSRYIAFVRGTGASKDNETSRLWLVSATGGTPVALTRLNQRVRDQDGIVDIGNSMPTWAPSLKRSEFWLAFSSLRDYGNVLRGVGRDQLWGAAIDPARIAQGKDPSYAAFWMPFQQINEGNHRAFWAIDTQVECPSTVEVCDELDNDCDGVVDENCCMPVAEICGNGKDDDCDGKIDNGCVCQGKEICGNGKDDDCDNQIDEGCDCQSMETCGNGNDDDCDGQTDSADSECVCKPTAEMCMNDSDDDCDGKIDSADEDCACTPVIENCTNGVDDDCDGKIDDNDGECVVLQ